MPPKEKKEAAAPVDPGLVARSYVNPTPYGELKSMDEPMEPAYKPHAVEASWNDWWEVSGYYKGDSSPEDKRPKFSICLPPPNVTKTSPLPSGVTRPIVACSRKFTAKMLPSASQAGPSMPGVNSPGRVKGVATTSHSACTGREQQKVALRWYWSKGFLLEVDRSVHEYKHNEAYITPWKGRPH